MSCFEVKLWKKSTKEDKYEKKKVKPLYSR